MVTTIKARRWCPECERYVLAERPDPTSRPGHYPAHALLAVITCGLWLPFWAFVTTLGALNRAMFRGDYRCPRCGAKC